MGLSLLCSMSHNQDLQDRERRELLAESDAGGNPQLFQILADS
ncbi:MAG: hypothetical protein R6V27_06865 [Balneolaceae bacterium]